MKKTGQKLQESEQKRSETGQIFLWLTKKNEKLTGQLVGQETDQNHMDVPKFLLLIRRKV